MFNVDPVIGTLPAEVIVGAGEALVTNTVYRALAGTTRDSYVKFATIVAFKSVFET